MENGINKIIIALLFSLAVGFFLSRALISIVTVAFFLTGVYWKIKYSNPLIGLQNLENKTKAIICFYLVILICAVATFQTDCITQPLLFFSPCLLLPLSFEFLTPRLIALKKYIDLTNWIFITATLLLLLDTAVRQGFDSNAITQLAEQSKNVRNSLGIHHNIVGFLAVFSITYLVYSLKQQVQIWQAVLLSLFIILIHYLGLRFALISFYLLMPIFLLRLKIKIRTKICAIVVCILMIFLSFTFIPAFKARYQNTRADFKNIVTGGNPNYWSLNQRLIANDIAYEIAKKHWLFGVGACNIQVFFAAEYKKDSRLLIPENRVFIHNQLLYGWATFGILYMIAWITFFGYLIYRGIKEKSILLEITLLFLMHQMVEKTLEKQLMLVLLIYFTFLMPSGLEENSNTKSKKFKVG